MPNWHFLTFLRCRFNAHSSCKVKGKTEKRDHPFDHKRIEIYTKKRVITLNFASFQIEIKNN